MRPAEPLLFSVPAKAKSLPISLVFRISRCITIGDGTSAVTILSHLVVPERTSIACEALLLLPMASARILVCAQGVADVFAAKSIFSAPLAVMEKAADDEREPARPFSA